MFKRKSKFVKVYFLRTFSYQEAQIMKYISRNLQSRARFRATDSSISIGVRAPSDLGGGDFLARKTYAMPERVGVEIGMQK